MYENRPPPEGINVSDEHPLKDFFILLGGIGVAIVILVIALSFVAGWLGRFVPFEVEKKWAQKALSFSESVGDVSRSEPQGPGDDQPHAVQLYLQDLADRLADAQGLPDGMGIRVHYVDDDTVNAFATLGGNVFIFGGLLEKLPHENALAMVMAHEIAHIKHRDPLLAAGRGLTVGLALASLAGFGNSQAVDAVLGQVATVTVLKYSRNQETAADIEAMATLDRYYGHLGGAEELFEVLHEHSQSYEAPIFLSTHPVTQQRIDAIKAYRRHASTTGALTALPTNLPLAR